MEQLPDPAPNAGPRYVVTFGPYCTISWLGGIPTRSATRSSKPDLNVISKFGEHGLDGCFEVEALSGR
jgi:hypothetical protein